MDEDEGYWCLENGIMNAAEAAQRRYLRFPGHMLETWCGPFRKVPEGIYLRKEYAVRLEGVLSPDRYTIMDADDTPAKDPRGLAWGRPRVEVEDWKEGFVSVGLANYADFADGDLEEALWVRPHDKAAAAILLLFFSSKG